MTYHVGLVQEGWAAILSDCRVTFGPAAFDGANTSLKSGLFFTGCIYAQSGSATASRDFIRFCKAEMARELADCRISLSEGWDLFLEVANKYDLRSSEPFQLLLSTRNRGTPTLVLFDSRLGVFEEQGSLTSIGSGKPLLDDLIRRIHSEEHGTVAALLDREGLYPENYPFCYCMMLMERVQGMESSSLIRAGVGGVFHFQIQSREAEGRQPPTRRWHRSSVRDR